jgi:hypothetical protein
MATTTTTTRMVIWLTNASSNGRTIRGQFGNSSDNPFLTPRLGGNNYSGRFLELVLLANVPQFIISLCYLQFNSVLTRLHMAIEWAAMGVDYRPLRVTEPRGAQTSTYRLQLPLTWSVPSIAISILLHWLVSNSLYIYISDGGKASLCVNVRPWNC